MRLLLKTAILAAGKTQRLIANEAGIPENRLSRIVRGWVEPREAERLVLQTLLHIGPVRADASASDPLPAVVPDGGV